MLSMYTEELSEVAAITSEGATSHAAELGGGQCRWGWG